MPELLEPSEWAVDRFGGCWGRVAPALYDAGLAAHERALDAKDASQLGSNDAYGATYWLALFEEVTERVGLLPEAWVVRPDRARYSLPCIGGTMLFPTRFGSRSQGVDHLRLSPSTLRSMLLSPSNDRSMANQQSLDLGPGFNDDIRLAPPHGVEQTVLVAYDCDPRSGLQHIFTGDVRFDACAGLVTWLYREELPISMMRGVGVLAAVDADHERPFDDAPLPDLRMRLRNETTAQSTDPLR